MVRRGETNSLVLPSSTIYSFHHLYSRSPFLPKHSLSPVSFSFLFVFLLMFIFILLQHLQHGRLSGPRWCRPWCNCWYCWCGRRGRSRRGRSRRGRSRRTARVGFFGIVESDGRDWIGGPAGDEGTLFFTRSLFLPPSLPPSLPPNLPSSYSRLSQCIFVQ